MRNGLGLHIVGPGPAVASVALGGVSGNGSSVYPTVSGSRLWLDRNSNVYSDTAGTTPASVDGSIASWKAVGGAWGADLLTQATGSKRPTLKSNGVQSDGIDDRLILPSTISLAGAYTVYAVYDFTGAYFFATSFSGNDNTFGGAVLDVSTTNVRAFRGDASVIRSRNAGASFSGLTMIRVRRTAAGNIHIGYSGGGDSASLGALSYTFTLENVIFNGGGVPDFQSSSVRTRQLVLVEGDTVTSGDDAAIQSALSTLEPGVVTI